MFGSLFIVLGLVYHVSASVIPESQAAFTSPDLNLDINADITAGTHAETIQQPSAGKPKYEASVAAQSYGESCTPTTYTLVNIGGVGVDICLAAGNCEYHLEPSGNCAMSILPSTIPDDPEPWHDCTFQYISTVQAGTKALNYGNLRPYHLANTTTYDRCREFGCISNWAREFDTTLKSRLGGWWKTYGKVYGWAESVQHPGWNVRDALANATRETAGVLQLQQSQSGTSDIQYSLSASEDLDSDPNLAFISRPGTKPVYDKRQTNDHIHYTDKGISYSGPDWYQVNSFLQCIRPGRLELYDFQQYIRVRFEANYMQSKPHNDCLSVSYRSLLGDLRWRWGEGMRKVLGDVVGLSCA